MIDIPVSGGETIIDRPLRYNVIRNALYIPKDKSIWYDNDPNWGIFDNDDLVRDAAYIRGPGDTLVGQSWKKTLSPRDIKYLQGVYVYGGSMQPHYGHFLFDSIARFWHNERNFKFIVQGPVGLDDWFSYEFVSEIFGTIGISRSDFLRPEEPCFIENLIVPEPSIIETHSVHDDYGHLGTKIGHHLVPDVRYQGTPVYVSKRELKRGIWAAENEDVVEALLSKRGVKIVHPQKLSLADQIRMFAEHIVVGLEGSAFHTAAITPVQTKSIIIVKFAHKISNFTLIDKIKHNDVTYISDGKCFENVGKVGEIDAMFRIPDPVAIAEDVLREIDRMSSGA